MGIWEMLGISDRAVIAKGRCVMGRVTEVRRIWWIKINTKPVRKHAFDGAEYPMLICFSYEAEGAGYSGKRVINYTRRCPAVGEALTVYYDPARPERYAVKMNDKIEQK